MTKNRILPAVMVLCLVFAAMAVPGGTDAQSTDSPENGRSRTMASFSYTPIYQFETDLDSGGEFDVQRNLLRFNISRFIDRHWTVGLGLSFDYEDWNFSDIAGLSGVDPWNEVMMTGINLPVFYSSGSNWRFGIIPYIGLSGASGAQISESLYYGAVMSAAYIFGPDLILGLGGGIFERLDQSEVFPYVVIDWKINDRLWLTNPFQAGPVGPAGLELVYTPDGSWEVGIGGAYRSYRFRLDDSSAVADGIGTVDFWAPFLRVGWQMGRHFRLDINGGAMVGGSITIEDENGTELGDTCYDTAPFIGMTLKGRL
jgi:hypothetical protein